MATTLKSGTRIQTTPPLGVSAETGVIRRWTKAQGPRGALPNYHRVQFDADGKFLLLPEGSFRVLDNRGTAR